MLTAFQLLRVRVEARKEDNTDVNYHREQVQGEDGLVDRWEDVLDGMEQDSDEDFTEIQTDD